MKIKTEEISLEELNNNVVEYVLKSPHNTNPAILRQMLNSRGASAQAKSALIFAISSNTDLGDEIDDSNCLANVVTGEIVTPEELAKITLSGTGFIAQQVSGKEGIQIGENKYSLSQILGFIISGSGMGITCIHPSEQGIIEISITDIDYKQAYLDALMQEIF